MPNSVSAWIVNFGVGYDYIGVKSNAARLRLVRAGQ
jgi:hypothetical protein